MGAVIRDVRAYQRSRDRDDLAALRALTIDEAIALTEELLASELVRAPAGHPPPRPRNLARSLGLATRPPGELLPLERGSAGRVILAALGEGGAIYDRIRREGYCVTRGERSGRNPFCSAQPSGSSAPTAACATASSAWNCRTTSVA